MPKIHMSLPVTDLAATERFYRTLFDAPPSKQEVDYLKFEPDDVPVNISFSPTRAGHLSDTARHLGIQYASQDELDAAFERLSAAGLVEGDRETSVCCYASQDKFWLRDPDGYEWELYYRLSDSDTKVDEGTRCCGAESERAGCC